MSSSVLLSGFVGQVLKRENYIEIFGLLFSTDVETEAKEHIS